MVDKVRVLLSLKTTIVTSLPFGSNQAARALTLPNAIVLNC